jgi:hypothetical protein
MARYEYIYYNALINNIDSNSSIHHEPPLTFNEQRDGPLITNCQDYDMSIANFKVDLKTLPTFIPTIKYADDDSLVTTRNKTIYSITLAYDGYASTAHVFYQPQDKTNGTTPPMFKQGFADYRSGYYNLYNYEFFFVMVNEAIKEAFNGLQQTLLHYNKTKNLGKDMPYFIFDKDTGLIYLNAPEETFNDDTLDEVSIYLNRPLYRLFNSLPFSHEKVTLIKIDGNVTMSGFKINMSNFGNVNESLLLPPQSDGSIASVKVDYLTVYQDYSTLDTWSPVESIVISSNTIPVRSSNTSANHSFENGSETVNGSSNIVELELSDFKSGTPIPGVIYEPSYPRWLNMRNQSELTNINLEMYYRSKLDGSLIPIHINSGGTFSLKLVFRKLM